MLEKTCLVYCTKCGFKTEDDANVCAKCGAPIRLSDAKRRCSSDNECFGSREREWENECFWLPQAGAIAGVILGILILIIGVAILLQKSIWQYLWPSLAIILGLLVIIGALYGRRIRY